MAFETGLQFKKGTQMFHFNVLKITCELIIKMRNDTQHITRNDHPEGKSRV